MRLLMLPDDDRARECAITVARALLAYQAHLDYAAGLLAAAAMAESGWTTPGHTPLEAQRLQEHAYRLRALATR